MIKVAIIGTSPVVEHHIKCLKKLNMKVVGICTTNLESKNHWRLQKKYQIKFAFSDIDKFLIKFKEKNICFFLAPRIEDTEKILLKCLYYKKKIFVEKPLSLNLDFYKKIKKYKKFIFIGYNRIYYHNIIYLKKKLNNPKNTFIELSCSEENNKKILTNFCHLISILLEIYKNIDIKRVIREKNFILVYGSFLNKNSFTFRISFNSPENSKIKIINKKIIYKLMPIEVLSEYSGLVVKKENNLNIYEPNLIKKINELKINQYKPGFLNQAKKFRDFVKNKKINYVTLEKSYEIMKICRKIYGD